MAGYQRFVAYVYEYQKGKKGNNCGYVKVEVRGERCCMELHLQCPGLTPKGICRCYGFVRNSGLMDGYLLGQCETSEGTAECIMETDAGNMGNAGVSLERMGGMIFRTENGAFFGTDWDVQPIRPENFREIIVPIEKDTTPPASFESQTPSQDPPILESETIEAEEITEPALGTVQNLAEPTTETIENPTEPPIETIENPTEPATETIQNPVEPTMSTAETIPNPAKPTIKETSAPNRPINFGEKYSPFSDGEIIQCRKIHPRDLVHFPRCDCALRGNRFLMYGYYNFGHLLLGRKKSGHYILGVPGGYDQQERFMASMFGFPYFKESKEIELPRVKGGYWFRLINPPNFY